MIEEELKRLSSQVNAEEAILLQDLAATGRYSHCDAERYERGRLGLADMELLPLDTELEDFCTGCGLDVSVYKKDIHI